MKVDHQRSEVLPESVEAAHSFQPLNIAAWLKQRNCNVFCLIFNSVDQFHLRASILQQDQQKSTDKTQLGVIFYKHNHMWVGLHHPMQATLAQGPLLVFSVTCMI